MSIILELLPVVIMAVYSSFQCIKGKGLRYMWPFAVIPLFTGGIWFVLDKLFHTAFASLIVMVCLLLFSFEIFHVRSRKMSVVYHLLFYLAIAVVAGGAVYYKQSMVINEYVLLLLYLLTESNSRYLKKSYEESATLYQNQLLAKQVVEVQNIYMTMRGWRHDYHNHLQTLKALLKLEQTEEANSYLNRLESDLDSINHLIESGNIHVDAILNSKLSLALKGDIDINYKAEVPAVLTVSDIDLCVLIGNLIDNAVESCEKMEDRTEGRFIRFYIGVLKKQLYISVTNSTSEVIRKLDEDYITTKRGNHGHGLKRINNIVEKYEGYINRKNEPGVFVTEIMLPL